MGHLGGNYSSFEEPPLVSQSEEDMEKDIEPALRYLNKTNNTDLAEMLGLPCEGEN